MATGGGAGNDCPAAVPGGTDKSLLVESDWNRSLLIVTEPVSLPPSPAAPTCASESANGPDGNPLTWAVCADRKGDRTVTALCAAGTARASRHSRRSWAHRLTRSQERVRLLPVLIV